MNIKRFIQTTFFAMAAVTMSAVSPVRGSWAGNLELTPTQRLKLIFNIGDGDVTLDSPDQGAVGLRGRIDFMSDDSVSLSFPNLRATYRASLVNTQLRGTFEQGALRLPLTLKRGQSAVLSRPQTPTPPFPYTTREVTVENGEAGVRLAGTLSLPDGANASTPAVVMVTGSGLQNRDEEVFGHKPFAVIADYLARRGVASLRYDDRGAGASTGDGASATTRTFASDAACALAFLRTEFPDAKVGVLGHSEGAAIACMLAAGEKAPDFIVGMGTPAVRGDSILVDQNENMLLRSGVPAETVQRYSRALYAIYDSGANLGAPGLVDSITAPWPALPMEMQLKANLKHIVNNMSPWLLEFVHMSPAPALSTMKCPSLLLYGEKDTQVTPALNYNVARTLAPAADIRLMPGLNHLMQPAITGQSDEYGKIEITMAPEVLDAIERFIHAPAADN